MTPTSTQLLFIHELSGLLSAEREFSKTLNKLKNNAITAELKQFAAEHYEETLEQIVNLNTAFSNIGQKPQKVTCSAVEGICQINEQTLQGDKSKSVIRDIALIGGGSHVEYYEIAGYSRLITIAKSLKMAPVVKLLQANLKQEQSAAQKLEWVAQTLLNGGGKIHGKSPIQSGS